ncbi:class I SAM-dependent methyltransferase [Castellaniella sp.]|uniref:class I SAM-dependent methyltransferase n=1 Tax=Castellaniella sp. TaxID=1955812 RepID=UPI0039C8727C
MKNKINLGCGPIYVDSPDWLNLDFQSSGRAVRAANLLNGLPAQDESAKLVYSSHFLEHVPRGLISSVISECFRVLAPGGVIRLVLPDLQNMAAEYLRCRLAGEHERADFVVLEMVDQCVRREPGGELGKYYQSIAVPRCRDSQSMIDYVALRVGRAEVSAHPVKTAFSFGRLSAAVRSRIFELRVRLCLLGLPRAFKDQNVSMASLGERHHWLWDFHQLSGVLSAAGFSDAQVVTATTSRVADFPFQQLDVDNNGTPRKGLESMYVEACKQ